MFGLHLHSMCYHKRILLVSFSLLRRGVHALSADTLSKIILDTRMKCAELTLFLALKEWSDLKGLEKEDAGSSNATAGKSIAKNINLAQISPSDLLSIVMQSGLVEQERVYEAFRDQALRAERQGVCFGGKRFYDPFWTTSKDQQHRSDAELHSTEASLM